MLGKFKIACDEWAEVWDLLKNHADQSFWQWSDVTFDPNTIYICGRVLFKQNYQELTELSQRYPGRIIFCNPAEGSETILLQLKRLRIAQQVQSGQIGLIASGDLAPDWNYCSTDAYFSNIVTYMENQQAAAAPVHCNTTPFDFLFLNGRLRPHRKYLIDKFRTRDLLQNALWTNLQSAVDLSWTSSLTIDSTEPIRLLPAKYEIERAQQNLGLDTTMGFVKHALFNHTWGDAIINAKAYHDTCFSVVTETVCEYPYTFRTEKIWKPIIMQHAFVVAANPGYLRDLRSAGFKTFGHLIDESFDQEPHTQTRLDRLVDQVSNICYNGAVQFQAAAKDICIHNQQHLAAYNADQRRELIIKLLDYLHAWSKIIY